MTDHSNSLALFAYNEERHISAALCSIDEEAGLAGIDLRVHVLANGCSDKTVARAKSYSPRHIAMRIHEIDIGDKANSWNLYVHNIWRSSNYSFFMDGDVRMKTGSIKNIIGAAQNDHQANAFSTLPQSGRTRKKQTAHIRKMGGLPGCLYMLPLHTMEKIREQGFSMPVGFIGEDVLLCAYCRRDFAFQNPDRREAIHVCEDTGYEFDSLSIFSPHDIYLYYRRLRRNSLRQLQNAILFPQITEKGNSALPSTIDEIYDPQAVNSFQPRSGFPNFLFDRLTKYQVQKKISDAGKGRHGA